MALRLRARASTGAALKRDPDRIRRRGGHPAGFCPALGSEPGRAEGCHQLKPRELVLASDEAMHAGLGRRENLPKGAPAREEHRHSSLVLPVGIAEPLDHTRLFPPRQPNIDPHDYRRERKRQKRWPVH